MSSPDHECLPSGVGCPVAAEHVWHTVGNTIGQNRFAECRETTRTQRVRNSARRINHCAGEDFLLTVRRRYADHEWAPDPIIPSQLIAAESGDSDDTMLHMQEGMDRWVGSEWFEPACDELAAGRVSLRRRGMPALGGEKLCRKRIKVEPPGREHPDMRPAPDHCADGGTSLQYQERQAPLGQMCSRDKPDRPGTDHNDRKVPR